MLIHTMGAHIVFYGKKLDYDDSYYGKQNVHCDILPLSMLDNTKRNCILLPLGVYGTVILPQFHMI